jgi:hypothetical protein
VDEAERDTGTVVTDDQLWAIALLERGLSPCIVELDEQGREHDRWGNVVDRESILAELEVSD